MTADSSRQGIAASVARKIGAKTGAKATVDNDEQTGYSVQHPDDDAMNSANEAGHQAIIDGGFSITSHTNIGSAGETRTYSDKRGRTATLAKGAKKVAVAIRSNPATVGDEEDPEIIPARASDESKWIRGCTSVDAISVGTQRERDPETGFVKVPAVIARVGIQTYKASEFPALVKKGMSPNKTIRLYRGADELLKASTVKSYENATITNGHPAGYVVHSKNWRKVSHGEGRDMKVTGDSITGNLILKDEKGLKALDSGKKFTSGGYKFDLDLTPGIFNGDSYDGVQRNIEGNHIALTDKPRGGHTLRVADSRGEKIMKLVTVDSIGVEVEDGAQAAVLEKFVKGADETKIAHETLKKKTIKIGDKSFTAEQMDEAQVAADALLPASAVETAVAARVVVIGDAMKLHPEIKIGTSDTVTIQRETLKHCIAKDEATKNLVAALCGDDLDKGTAEQIGTAFKAVAANPPKASGTARRESRVGDALAGTREVTGDDVPLTGRALMMDRQQNPHKYQK